MPYYSNVSNEADITQINIMKTYDITTDAGSTTIKAESVTEALMEWGEAPDSVTTTETFEEWLENVGGFGNIQEDGVIIARVAS